jgi:hypothetical protein
MYPAPFVVHPVFPGQCQELLAKPDTPVRIDVVGQVGCDEIEITTVVDVGAEMVVRSRP